jgi:hypothetical protein
VLVVVDLLGELVESFLNVLVLSGLPELLDHELLVDVHERLLPAPVLRKRSRATGGETC